MGKHLPAEAKYKLLEQVLKGKESVASVCRRAGISRTIFYRWQKEFLAQPESLLAPRKRFFRQTPPDKEKLVLDLVFKHPEYSTHKISQALGINHKGKLILGNHGVQNVLRRFGLSTLKARLAFKEAKLEVNRKPLWQERKILSPEQRAQMIKRVIEGGEKVAQVSREFGVSRVIFYRWLRRYRQAPHGLELQNLNNKERKVERYWRQVEPRWEKEILDLVLGHPEWSVPKITVALRQDQGEQVVGYYGIQRVLERNNLNTYERRLTYQQSLTPIARPIPAPMAVPEVTGPPKIWRLLRAPFATVPKLAASFRSLLLIFFLAFTSSFIFYRFLLMLAEVPTKTQIGLVFATISLTFGAFFFLYSLKYYFTLILILGFSRQVSGGEQMANGKWQMANRENGNGRGSIWQRIFGFANHRNDHNGKGNGNGQNGDSYSHGGLQADLSQVKLERRPFVSVHLPIYNERRVVERLLAACTSLDYENYEVVVVDDSTDETTEILKGFLKRGRRESREIRGDQGEKIVFTPTTLHSPQTPASPVVTLIHRSSREGFKGGALKVALENTSPQAEFILVFDADFLPYPDTITQFLKYFQVTAGGLDFRNQALGTRVWGLGSEKESTSAYTLMPKPSSSPIAAVQGYQWHVLNKSENWITRGVRSEYAGSYVVERSGGEALGALKQIAGAVYMIRAPLLRAYGWGTSLTEDFELTLKLYQDGYKVVYTPYIQTPSECVSTLRRLIRQRMRWAEGHTHNIRKMFWQLMFGSWQTEDGRRRTDGGFQRTEDGGQRENQSSVIGLQNQSSAFSLQSSRTWTPSKLTLMEKLEFLYLSPYYLQATLFMIGTLSWFISEALFQTRLPFWTSLWGWSLVFTNMLSLPLMNTVGLFLEESEERDYGGIISFIFLSYLLVPFQGYAALKGFLEKEEGPWFRTPKTGKITDIFTPGRFARFISTIFPGRAVGVQGRGVLSFLNPKPYTLNPYLALATANLPAMLREAMQAGNRFQNFRINRRKVRGLVNLVIVTLLLTSMALTYVSSPITPTLAYTGKFYFKATSADDLADTSSTGRKQMTTAVPAGVTQSFTLSGPASATYYGNDTAAASLTDPSALTVSAATNATNTTRYGSQRKIFRDIYGNLIMVFVDNAIDIKAAYLNASVQSWNEGSGAWAIFSPDIADAVTAQNVAATLDSSGDLHIVYEDTQTVSQGQIQYKKITISRTAGVINSSGWTIPSATTLDAGTTNINVYRPSLVMDKNNQPGTCWGYVTSGGGLDSQVRFSRYTGAAWTCATGTGCQTCNAGAVNCDYVLDSAADSQMHCALGRMPDAAGANTNDDALYVLAMENDLADLYAYKATVSGTDYNAWASVVTLDSSVGTNTSGTTYDLTVSPSHTPDQDALAGLLVAWATTSNNTALKILRNKDGGTTPDDLSISPAASLGSQFSLVASSSAQPNIYLFSKSSAGMIVYRKHGNASPTDWDSSDTTFQTGTINTYPQVKDAGLYAGASGNSYNDGGRIDVALYIGSATLRTNYVPLAFKTLSTSAGTSAVEKTVGTTGWDDLHFLTTTFSSRTVVGSENWTLKVCFGSSYAAGKAVRARWEIVPSTGTASCTTTLGGECGTYVTLTDAVNSGQQCESNTSVTPPSNITDLNGWRLKLRVNYDNDGSDIVPVRYDDSSANSGDTSLAGGLGSANDTFYVLTDNLNKKWTSGDTELPTEGTTSEQRNVAIATDSSGNTFAAWEDSRNSQGLGTWAAAATATYSRYYHQTTPLLNGKVLTVGTGFTNGGLSIAEIYDPALNTFSTTAPSTYARYAPTATLLSSGKVLVAGTDSSNAGRTIAELYDPALNTFSTTGTMTYARSAHTATLLPNGKVLVVGTAISGGNGGLSIAEIYDPSLNTFSTTGPTTYSRYYQTATLLSNGKVLVVGTSAVNGGRSIAEIYDPQAGSWSRTGISTYTRSNPAATLLPSGKVLVVGTVFTSGGTTIPELYDPVSQTWATTGYSTYIRQSLNTILLNNGKVLVVGTNNAVGGRTIPEIYDPASQSWTTSGVMTYSRSDHSVTLLNNGKVLVVGTSWIEGGQTIPELYSPQTFDIYAQKFNSSGTKQWGSDVKVNSDDGSRSTAANNPSNYDHLNPRVKLDSSGNPIIVWQEARNSVYGDDIMAQKLATTDGAKQWPAATTGTWSTTGYLTYARDFFTATLLSNGKILAVGTALTNGGQTVPELYDPSTQAWSTTGATTYARNYFTATLLQSGKVLVVGTNASNGGQSIAELYDPSTQAWSTTGNMTYARTRHTATFLSSGKVLVAGTTLTNGGQTIPELYDPSLNTFATTGTMTYSRDRSTATLLQSGKILVTGTFQDNGGFTIAEIYDPQTQAWSTTGKATYSRFNHTATLLNNGKVLVAGAPLGNGLSIAELYDPSTQAFSTTGPSTYGRALYTANLLQSGKVLVTGTSVANGGQSIAELYDPSANTFSTTAPSTYGRDDFTATPLANGKILMVGTTLTNGGQTIPELYLPSGDIPVSNDGSPSAGSGLPRPEYPAGGKGILGEQTNPVLAVDTSNNVVVAWEDSRFAAMQNWGLSFNYDSNAWWQTNINLAASGVCNGGGGWNTCGAIPAIQASPLRIMGQKLLGTDGSKQWGDDVNAVNQNNPEDLGLASTGDYSSKPAMAADGTNLVVTWESNGGRVPANETKNYDIYAQQFNLNGVSQWGGTWAQKAGSTYARSSPTTTLLPNGKVLVVGTKVANGGYTIAELYDPVVNTWSTTGTTTYYRYNSTSTLLSNNKVLVVGTFPNTGGQTIPELYDPSTEAFSTTGATTFVRYVSTSTFLSNGKVLVAGTSVGSSGQTIAELYDPSLNTWSTTGIATYARYYHTATLLQNGKVLLVGTAFVNGGLTIAEIYDPSTQAFSTTGVMAYARDLHTTTLLPNGKVLVVGTNFDNSGQMIAELYDPSTQAFSTTGTSTYARASHTATLLNNGKVLVAGTSLTNGGQSIPELYDPVTQAWTTTGSFTYARNYHAATLLPNGKVLAVGTDFTNDGQTIPELYSLDQLISGGVDLADQRNPEVAVDSTPNYLFAWQGRRGSGPGGGPFNGDSERGGGSWKIYGQKTNTLGSAQWPSGTAETWATTGNLTYARYFPTATLLPNGKVLTVGTVLTNAGQSTPELYDPVANTFSTTGTSTYSRDRHTATLLNNGQVLLVGTYVTNAGQSIPELYDPATQTWSLATRTAYARERSTATLLPNGKVLVTGTGFSNSGQNIAEVYNPATNSWSTTSTATYARFSHTATLLPNGKVLVTGTVYGNGGQTIAELYDPSANTFSTTGKSTYARYYPTATLLSNGKVLVVGTAFTNGGQSIPELYDPSTQAWATTGTSTYARDTSTATLLPNGKVLVTGTNFDNGGRSIPEIYDPVTQAWATTGISTYARDFHTAILLPNGKVLAAGTSQTNGGQTIPELYTPAKGEMMLSHDYAFKGDQENPKLATSGTSIYAVWQDNRSAIADSLTSDKNIFMQSFDTNGVLQWPAASDASGYESPYAVMDIRADTYAGNWGSHYSGKPSLGGIYTGSGGDKPLVLAWEDNRNSGDLMDIYGQSYDTLEQDINKSTNWQAFFDVNQLATMNVKVGMMEWDGTTPVLEGNSQTWSACSPACPDEQSLTWNTGGANPPPSDTVGNVTMRRLRVAFTKRTSGSVTIYYDDNTDSGAVCGTSGEAECNSRLSTGDIVPEKVLLLGLIIPFLPPAVAWWRGRRRSERMNNELRITNYG